MGKKLPDGDGSLSKSMWPSLIQFTTNDAYIKALIHYRYGHGVAIAQFRKVRHGINVAMVQFHARTKECCGQLRLHNIR